MVSGSAPRSDTMTGQPMACASMLVRPKVSATSEGITATGCEEGDRHVVAVTKQAHFVLKAMTRDETDQLLPVRGLAQSIAREDDDGTAECALAIEPCRGLDSLTVALKSREPRRLERSWSWAKRPSFCGASLPDPAAPPEDRRLRCRCRDGSS